MAIQLHTLGLLLRSKVRETPDGMQAQKYLLSGPEIKFGVVCYAAKG